MQYNHTKKQDVEKRTKRLSMLQTTVLPLRNLPVSGPHSLYLYRGYSARSIYIEVQVTAYFFTSRNTLVQEKPKEVFSQYLFSRTCIVYERTFRSHFHDLFVARRYR